MAGWGLTSRTDPPNLRARMSLLMIAPSPSEQRNSSSETSRTITATSRSTSPSSSALNSAESLTGDFKNMLTVEASAMDATMVDMTLHADHIQKGIDFLDMLIEKYISNSLEEKNHLATKTIEPLDFQLADISESLGSSEQELQDIRRTSSVMNIDEKAGNIYNQRQEAETQRDEIERRRSYLVQMQDYFESDKDSTGFLAPSAMGLQDPLLSGLIEQLTTLNAERQQILWRSGIAAKR